MLIDIDVNGRALTQRDLEFIASEINRIEKVFLDEPLKEETAEPQVQAKKRGVKPERYVSKHHPEIGCKKKGFSSVIAAGKEADVIKAWNEKLSMKKMIKKTGLGNSAIRNYLKRFGIESFKRSKRKLLKLPGQIHPVIQDEEREDSEFESPDEPDEDPPGFECFYCDNPVKKKNSLCEDCQRKGRAVRSTEP